MKYIFIDKETGYESAHETIEGIAEMLVDEWNEIAESIDDEKITFNKMNREDMKKYIYEMNYEIIEKDGEEK